MKGISYNQLQIKMLVAMVLLFLVTVTSYRVFVETPQLSASIVKLEKRDLSSLKYQVNQSIKNLQLLVTDYADWDASYDYIQKRDDSYTEEHFINSAFTNLKIDGVFIVDKSFNLIYSKGLNYKTAEELHFEFLDVTKFPQNTALSPLDKSKGVFSGVVSTRYGAAFFSSKTVKKSNHSGEYYGFMVFIRLIDKYTFSDLSEAISATVSAMPIQDINSVTQVHDWLRPPLVNQPSDISQRVVKDLHDIPLLLVSIKHADIQLPSLIDHEILMFGSVFLLLNIVIFMVVSHYIVLPVKQLATDIKSIQKGAKIAYLNRSYSIYELENVSTEFNALIDIVNQQNHLLYQQTIRDPLTGINNRRGFDHDINKHSQLFIREKISFTVIMVDVDFFKRYNDHFGHPAGDEALIEVAKLLQQYTYRENDYCARYGGEEFALIFSNIDDVQLKVKLEAIIDSFSDLNLEHPKSLVAPFLTVSLGACTVDVVEDLITELSVNKIIEKADNALYQAKHNGRNQYVITHFLPKK